MEEMIYKAPSDDSEPHQVTVGVKFANNIYLHESFLKQQNIEYTKSELENTALGLAHVIIREHKSSKDF